MNKQMWSIHTMEYYSAIQGNKVLIHGTTRMNLGNISLSERSQTQKVTDPMILLSGIGESTATEADWQLLGPGSWGVTAHWVEGFLFRWQMCLGNTEWQWLRYIMTILSAMELFNL